MAGELPQTLSQALPPGTLLKEYRLQSVLGMGSFGITYLATDGNLDLKVAIKEFFPASVAVRNPLTGAVALNSEKAQAEYAWGKDRFMREAQTLARFSHPNIVRVFRYFEDNGTCYMVMEYEEGQSLESALAGGPARWDQPAVFALMMPLLAGMESVHAAGFLHRDIKPANIVLRGKDDSPVLIDFGAARAPSASDALTVVLSHGYGPPEQYSREGNQGPWTDIYALAGVLYRIVSGSVPPISLHRIKQDPIIPATFSGEGRFGPKFLQAIDLALSIDETRRPQSIAEWRKQLVADAAGTEAAASAPPRGEPSAAPKAAPAAAGSPNRPATSPPRPRPGPRIVEEAETGLSARIGRAMIAHPFLSLLVLAAALFATLHLLRKPAKPPPQPVPAIVTEPASRTPAAEGERMAAPPSAERREPVATAIADDERLPNIRRAALAACEGMAIGTPCRVVGPRNQLIDATCVSSAEGLPICRPARPGARPSQLQDPSGAGPESRRPQQNTQQSTQQSTQMPR